VRPFLQMRKLRCNVVRFIHNFSEKVYFMCILIICYLNYIFLLIFACNNNNKKKDKGKNNYSCKPAQITKIFVVQIENLLHCNNHNNRSVGRAIIMRHIFFIFMALEKKEKMMIEFLILCLLCTDDIFLFRQ